MYLLRDSNTEVHVLIRPRSGNFCYSNNEFDVMLRDIILVKQAGADVTVSKKLHLIYILFSVYYIILACRL